MRLAICLLIAWAQFSCNSENSKNPNPNKTVSVDKTSNGNAAGDSSPTGNPKTGSSPKAVYHGTINATAGNDQPMPGEIELSLGDSNSVSGIISLQEKSLLFKGIDDQGTIRAWLGSKSQNDESPLSGYLVGTRSDDKAQGDFALSGNAGVPNIRGKWEAKLK